MSGENWGFRAGLDRFTLQDALELFQGAGADRMPGRIIFIVLANSLQHQWLKKHNVPAENIEVESSDTGAAINRAIAKCNQGDGSTTFGYANDVIVLGSELPVVTTKVTVPLALSGLTIQGTVDSVLYCSTSIDMIEVNAYRCNIRDIMFYTSKSSHVGKAIHLNTTSSWSKVERCQFLGYSQDLQYGVYVTDAEFFEVRNCLFEDCTATGVALDGGTNNISSSWVIEDNLFDGCLCGIERIVGGAGTVYDGWIQRNYFFNDDDDKDQINFATGTNSRLKIIKNMFGTQNGETDDKVVLLGANNVTAMIVENYVSNTASGGSGGTLLTVDACGTG